MPATTEKAIAGGQQSIQRQNLVKILDFPSNRQGINFAAIS